MQAHALQLRGDVARGDVIALRTRGPAFKQTIGQETNVGADLFRANYFSGEISGGAVRRTLSKKVEGRETQPESQERFHLCGLLDFLCRLANDRQTSVCSGLTA